MKFDKHSLQANQHLSNFRSRLQQGLPAHPHSESVIAWLQQHRSDIKPLLADAINIANSVYFDLSVPDQLPIDQVTIFTQRINAQLCKAKADMGIGRYNENRHCYQSNVFRTDVEARTLHIGVDLFLPPMTILFCPLAATVHSFQNNNNALDYGPTIILRHQLSAELVLFSLYGHLSDCSLTTMEVGKPVAAGEAFARVGNFPGNGNWPPHVHVQLMLDMLTMQGDFPGVVTSNDADLWLTLCPNPDLILQLPSQRSANTVILAAV